jgi:hypothetical protein
MTGALEEPRTEVTVSMANAVRVRAVVAVARILSHQSPRRIRGALSVVVRGARPASLADAHLARDTVLTVSVACRGSRACLVRSIAAALLCRTRGTWPTWCVGVLKAPPFAAHAWIEAEGRLVDETIGGNRYARLISVETPPS